MTDWGSGGTSSSTSSATNWGGGTSKAISGGGLGGSSGGGGLFDWIGHEASSALHAIPGEHAVAGALGGASYVAGNAVHQGEQMIHGMPGLLGMVWHDVTTPSILKENLGTPIDKYLPWYNPKAKTIEQDPQNLIGQTVKGTLTDWSHLRKGDVHYFAKNPLNLPLDVASVASPAGRIALKGAAAAGEGSRLAALANDSGRVLQEGGLAHELPRSKTLQGRIAQNAFDKFSTEHPAAPVVGAQSRLMRAVGKQSYYRTQAELHTVRQFQHVGTPLSHEEQFAMHVAAEGIPLRDRISLFQKLNAEQPSKAISNYVKALQDPKVAQALTNPSDRLIQAQQMAHGLESGAGETLNQAGVLNPQIRAERAASPLAFAQEHGVQIGPSDISPKLEQGFRFPHVGTTGTPSLFSTPLASLMGPKAPGFLKKSNMVRFARAQIITNPLAVYSEDFMRTMRWRHQLDLQDSVITPASRELDAAKYERLYGKPADGFFYWPAKAQAAWKARKAGIEQSGVKLPAARIPPAAREAAPQAEDLGIAHAQDLGVADSAVHQESLATTAASTVAPTLKEMGLEGRTIEDLKAMGVRWVPKRYAEAYRKEFSRSNAMVRLFIDRPTDFWRSLTLKYRPAWAINNLMGQHLLYLMHNPSVAGAVAYAIAAAQHHKLNDTFDQLPGMRQGFATTQSRVTRAGFGQNFIDQSKPMQAAAALGKGGRRLLYPVRKMGDAIMRVNQLGENIPREAQFIKLMLDKHIGPINATIAEAIQGADPKTISRLVDEVNAMQGDFGQLSHGERTLLRRAFPFYSWFKVISKLTGRFVAHYPGRTKMLQANAAFLNEKNVNLPSYLQGFLSIGSSQGGEQVGLTTTGLNPFETDTQLLGAAGSLLHGKPKFGTDNPGGLMNPGFQALLTALSGQDQFTGGAYRGPGANQGAAGRFAGQFFSGLPEYRLAEQAAGMGPQSSLYSQQRYHGLPPYLWNYLGLPVRRVKLATAASRAAAGQ